MTKHGTRFWRRCFACHSSPYEILLWRFYANEWYCDKCYQRCVRRGERLVIRATLRTLFSLYFYSTDNTLPLMYTTTQRKNEIVDFISERENRISVLRTLYEEGWRLLLLPDHSKWQEPRGTSIKLGKTKSVMTYYFGIDDEELTVDIIAMIKPDLLNSDAASIVETINKDIASSDWHRVENGTLLKIILTNSPSKTYRSVWRLGRISVVQVPISEKRIEDFEDKIGMVTHIMTGIK